MRSCAELYLAEMQNRCNLPHRSDPQRCQVTGRQRAGMSMVHDVLDAYARLDVDAAIQVVRDDENADREYQDLIRMLITYMMEDPRTISEVLDVIWAARALERIGDHAKNIAEYVIYLVKGKDIRHLDLDEVEKDILS